MTERRQYAVVHDGQVLSLSDGGPAISPFLDEPPEPPSDYFPPGSVWLPVTTHDSQPFILGQSIRVTPPRYEVHGDEVWRVYEIREFKRRVA